MHARLRMYKYCYSNLGAIYAKGLCLQGAEKKKQFSNLNFEHTVAIMCYSKSFSLTQNILSFIGTSDK